MQHLLDVLHSIFDINMYTGLVTIGLVCAAYGLIKLITDSMLLASLFTPLMALGGLTANYYFTDLFIQPLQDKDSNIVLAVATGVLAAMLVMLAITRVVYILSEKRTNRTRRRLHPSAAPAE